MIVRSALVEHMQRKLAANPVVALLGPRQCGKTTLARYFLSAESENYFDLEDPRAIARLGEPMLALESLRGLVVLDEIQLRPDLFPVLRVLADQKDIGRTFLVLGSAAPELLQQSSETLAGRIAFVRMRGFSLQEVGLDSLDPLWLRGGFPGAYLASSETESYEWRSDFIATFIQRDLPMFGHKLDSGQMQRFWAMLAHYNGQITNRSAIAQAMEQSRQTITRHLDLLEGYYLIRQLKPWHSNLRKREVKAPKLYFRDTGLLHAQHKIRTKRDLQEHPQIGASWEAFAIEQIIQCMPDYEPYFWSVHTGAEIDLVLVRGAEKVGVEFKRTDAPKKPAVAINAAQDLGLSHLWVVYPRGPRYPLAPECTAISLPEWVQVHQ